MAGVAADVAAAPRLPPDWATGSVDEDGRRFPSIVVLHGNGNNASVFAASSLSLREASLAHGYALIWPEGVPTPDSTDSTKERSWNAGTCCGEAVIGNADDMGFLAAVATDAIEQFRLDPSQVFLTGELRLTLDYPHCSREQNKQYRNPHTTTHEPLIGRA